MARKHSRPALDCQLYGTKGIDHANDGQKQADHRGNLGKCQNRRQEKVQVRENLQFNDIRHRPSHGGKTLFRSLKPGREQFPRDHALLCPAITDGAVHALLFELLLECRHELVHLRFCIHVEEDPPDDQRDSAAGHEEKGNREVPFLRNEFQKSLHGSDSW